MLVIDVIDYNARKFIVLAVSLHLVVFCYQMSHESVLCWAQSLNSVWHGSFSYSWVEKEPYILYSFQTKIHFKIVGLVRHCLHTLITSFLILRDGASAVQLLLLSSRDFQWVPPFLIAALLCA